MNSGGRLRMFNLGLASAYRLQNRTAWHELV